ncbi:MAG: Smr/MutS family protein [Magnetospirillum sp. WYHS-4]
MTVKPGKSRHRVLAPDEEELWAHVVASVKPLRRRRRQAQAIPAATSAPDPETATSSCTERPRILVIPPPPPVSKLPPDLTVGSTAGVDKRTAERFRKGEMSLDGAIDLHRHTQDEAHRALDIFLLSSQTAGRRCVLVITGKGRTTGGSVLRAMVPRWLNEAPLRTRILAVAPAQPRHGGSGAFYVLLKRKR